MIKNYSVKTIGYKPNIAFKNHIYTLPI